TAPTIPLKTSAELGTTDSGFIDIHWRPQATGGRAPGNQVVHIQLEQGGIPEPGLIVATGTQLHRSGLFCLQVRVGSGKIQIVEGGCPESRTIPDPHAVGSIQSMAKGNATGLMLAIGFVIITAQAQLQI